MLAYDPVLAVHGGMYISTIKIIPVLIVLFAWAHLLTWADKDAKAAHLPRNQLNMGNLVGLVIGFALFFILPTFILGFFAMLAVAGVEVAVYLHLRNKEVGLKDLQKEIKGAIEGSKKKATGAVAAYGAVSLIGKDGKSLPIPLDNSPDRAAYDAVQKVLVEPLLKGAQQIDVVPEGEALAVRYIVDTVSHNGPVFDRALGGSAIGYMKWAAALNVEDRRKPQTAVMKVMYEKTRHEIRVQTAGTTAGEYLRITIDPKTRHTYKLGELGFTDSQRKQVQDLIADKSGGVILLSAPRGHGLTSLFYTMLRSHDAFLEHAQTVERDQEQDLEGITQTKLAANAPSAEEAKVIDWVISQEPHVIGISRLDDAKAGAALIDYSRTEGHRVYVCMRTNSTFEAIEQWKRLIGDTNLATESLRLVINGRIVRKLCLACKEGFTPDPNTLKKLNLSPERVTTLYKAREQPLRDAKGHSVRCEFCHDVRYKGRTGVFETLLVDDEMRAAIDSGKSLNQAFRKQRGRYLQEEALTLVEHGDTSVQEVLRVLKPVSESGGGHAGGPAPVAARAPSRGAGPAVRRG